LLYAGLERGGKPLAQLVRFGPDGQFYDAAAGVGGDSGVRAATFAPVNGRVTSSFGMRRHPVLGYSRMHAGIDFGAAWGSPIFAVSDGVVSFAGRHGGHGNYVRLEHGDGLGTGYGHMSKIAVWQGTRVHAGQVIGYVGSTGLSTGPHLHWEAYSNGRTVNPLSVRFAAKAQAVDPRQAAALKTRLAQLKSVQPGAALKSLAAKQAVVR
jgi:murein DD-endopeptidase MepM/ murein hydrolase activator NlpD